MPLSTIPPCSGGPTLLILSLGELGTCLLESAARSNIFQTIFVASRSLEKAQERANNAATGAGIEGVFPDIRAVAMDFNQPEFPRQLRDLNPDFVFSAPSLLPWWKLGDRGANLPFASFTALHLSLMQTLRNAMAQADLPGVWIGASFPDVINPVLSRTGYGPTCGIGNVQEPIAKIQAGVAQAAGCAPTEIDVRLVAQHAFEYHVLNATPSTELPPYLLQASVGGRDVSDLAETALRSPYPFPYDLHFNRVTASAALVALRALNGEDETAIHLPGIDKLIGGYPVLASRAGIKMNLPADWSEAQAVAVNEASLPWDGIAGVDADGTIHYSQETAAGLLNLTGQPFETLTPDTAAAQAQALLEAL